MEMHGIPEDEAVKYIRKELEKVKNRVKKRAQYAKKTGKSKTTNDLSSEEPVNRPSKSANKSVITPKEVKQENCRASSNNKDSVNNKRKHEPNDGKNNTKRIKVDQN